ncbi:hypothetical protein CSQ89_21435 [Chitinimonas sp. BJB300]|nr:hypothetical protein CSQ89_21435 [Chitinimonas sp. BJB300]TSJ84945.1 hypothetical protein FG002_018480 [Chitinimonas sp. BJB300]TSJ84951.1 hypothetical protein FG002_018510 [Chitinimonas sp. BJB300]
MDHTALSPVAPSTQPASAFADYLTEELNRYDEHLHDVRGLAAGTRSQRVRVVRLLLQEQFADCPIEIAKLHPDDVRSFLARQLDAHRSHAKASLLASALRSYFRYRATYGDQVGGLTAVISTPVHGKLASLPRALGPDEADRLVKSLAPGHACRKSPASRSAISCSIRALPAFICTARAESNAAFPCGARPSRKCVPGCGGIRSLRRPLLCSPIVTGRR